MNKKILILLFFVPILLFFTFFKFDQNIKDVDDKNLHFYIVDKLSKFLNFNFKLIESKKIFFNKKEINFKRFNNDFLRYRFYLSQDKENIFLISKDGAIFYIFKKKLLNNDKFKLYRIKSNLKNLIGQKYISKYRTIIKGITIIDDEIFVSYLSNTNGCFSNSIAYGKLNLNRIYFSSFFKMNECRKVFNYSVGGNISKYKKNMLILSTGDFDIPENIETNQYEKIYHNEESDPQKKSSYFGKILSIDTKTKNTKVVSMGHRNPQGLFYDFDNDIIFSTDHGPKGGDEINVHIRPRENAIINYGWPKASYGVRYGEDLDFRDKSCEKIFLEKIAPLCKSHKKYGFEEPVKYFTPAIGITQILKIDNLKINDHHELLVASMGYDKEEDDMTMHMLKLDNFFQVKNHDKFYIGERIRDMIDLKNDHILISLESSPPPSIGLVKLNNN